MASIIVLALFAMGSALNDPVTSPVLAWNNDSCVIPKDHEMCALRVLCYVPGNELAEEDCRPIMQMWDSVNMLRKVKHTIIATGGVNLVINLAMMVLVFCEQWQDSSYYTGPILAFNILTVINSAFVDVVANIWMKTVFRDSEDYFKSFVNAQCFARGEGMNAVIYQRDMISGTEVVLVAQITLAFFEFFLNGFNVGLECWSQSEPEVKKVTRVLQVMVSFCQLLVSAGNFALNIVDSIKNYDALASNEMMIDKALFHDRGLMKDGSMTAVYYNGTDIVDIEEKTDNIPQRPPHTYQFFWFYLLVIVVIVSTSIATCCTCYCTFNIYQTKNTK